ncbi:hypothetical protein VCM43_18995 [Rhizobium sp. MJ21]|nr:hypothetical protein [Rhizobium sp. MJ21]
METVSPRLPIDWQAHDELIAAAHRAQADALEIEAAAKRRLADEYDAAQERGEIGQRTGRPQKDVPQENDFHPPTAAEVGLSRKDVHEARLIRDAETADRCVCRALTSAWQNSYPQSFRGPGGAIWIVSGGYILQLGL